LDFFVFVLGFQLQALLIAEQNNDIKQGNEKDKETIGVISNLNSRQKFLVGRRKRGIFQSR
jgi:hypothetical protein